MSEVSAQGANRGGAPASIAERPETYPAFVASSRHICKTGRGGRPVEPRPPSRSLPGEQEERHVNEGNGGDEILNPHSARSETVGERTGTAGVVHTTSRSEGVTQ